MSNLINKNILNFCLLIFAFINSFQFQIQAQTINDYKVLKDANKAYTEGEFQKAVDEYEKLVKSGLAAADLYYNLGNAYYRTGDYKSAILNYERAKKLDPNNENIDVNLELCQKFVQDKIEVVPKFFLVNWLNAFLNVFSSRGWAFISIFTFISFLCLVLLFLFTRSIFFRKMSFYLGIISFFISTITFLASYKQDQILTNHKTAIVFSQSVSVKSSPNESGTVLFIIHEGLKVSITDSSNGWKEIKLDDGRVGWLPDETIAEI
jgi:tetratricopeptide (TPR) repeat protein